MGRKGYNLKTRQVHLRDLKKKYNSLSKAERFEVDVVARQYEVGRHIWLLRHEYGITMTKLSKLSGVSRKAISRLENGQPVMLDTLIRVLEILKEKIDFKPIG